MTSICFAEIEDDICKMAAARGMRCGVTRFSGVSLSRYMTIYPERADGFDQGKAARREFIAQTRASYPRGTGLTVRISDHHGYGDNSIVHFSIRLDHDIPTQLDHLAVALDLLARPRAAA